MLQDRPRVAMLFANGCQVRTGDLTNRFENNIEKRRCQEMVYVGPRKGRLFLPRCGGWYAP